MEHKISFVEDGFAKSYKGVHYLRLAAPIDLRGEGETLFDVYNPEFKSLSLVIRSAKLADELNAIRERVAAGLLADDAPREAKGKLVNARVKDGDMVSIKINGLRALFDRKKGSVRSVACNSDYNSLCPRGSLVRVSARINTLVLMGPDAKHNAGEFVMRCECVAFAVMKRGSGLALDTKGSADLVDWFKGSGDSASEPIDDEFDA